MGANKITAMDESSLNKYSYFDKAFAYEVYQDLQDYLYNLFKKPSIIYICDKDDIIPCYPREKLRGFSPFCELLHDSDLFSINGMSICVQKEIEYIREGIKADANKIPWPWKWRPCHLGFIDYFMPIRSLPDNESQGSILAVLVIGHFRPDDSDKTINIVNDNISKLISNNDSARHFSSGEVVDLQGMTSTLSSLIASVPIKEDNFDEQLESRLRDIMGLMEIIATRTYSQDRFSQTKKFIQSIGLEDPDSNIDTDALWKRVAEACKHIIDYTNVKSSVIYISYLHDYNYLNKIVCIGDFKRPVISNSIELTGENISQLIENRQIFVLPTTIGSLSWINPMTFFGHDKALVFAKYTITGQTIVIGFGSEHQIAWDKHWVIEEALNEKIVPYIERSLYAISLDGLMAEIGHLIGHAIGSVASGYEILKENKNHSIELLKDADWAMEDGLMRLKILWKNFFSFREIRLGSKEATIPLDLQLMPDMSKFDSSIVDVIKVIRNLEGYFKRATSTSNLKMIIDYNNCKYTKTKGESNGEDDLNSVLLNLFDNALKFAYRNTYIELKVYNENEYIVITMTNLGIGVAKDEFKFVFYPSAQSRFKDPSRLRQGLGIGLSFCKRVIENSFKGTIMLISKPASVPTRRFEGDNWLTTLIVKLPIAKE